MSQPTRATQRPWYKNRNAWVVVIVALVVGFIIGNWVPLFFQASEQVALSYSSTSSTGGVSHPSLRLSGYQFISPLLACGLANQPPRPTPETQTVNNAIEAVIAKHEQAGDISKASAFFVDYSRNYGVVTNASDTYYPSSIGKIPIMMAYFAIAERTSQDILNQEITFPVGSPDLNDSQDIKPAEAIVPGQTYTVMDLIGYMIKYSDNNAAQLLYENVDQQTLNDIYTELGIPVDYDTNINNFDFMTVQQVSMLFRILYNGTYLSANDSEEALKLLSESSFTQGLAAGVPSSTVVAHKLGLVGIAPDGVTTEHELHDCGIVYVPNRPYLLCIMTRGASPLPNMENTIADISRTVYNFVMSGQ
jgi:beta-lactamase class A